MKTMLKKGVLALATGATLMAMTAPAEARGYYRGGYYGHRHSGNTGAAIAGGILGLAVGAAIASGANRDRGYYDRGYSRPYRETYYEDGYERRPYVEHYRSYRTCTTDRYWDDYRGGWTTIQRCD